MKQYIFKFSNWLIIPLLFSSCEKVIDLDLNSADPKIVIEGSITDQPGTYTVKLTRTVNFDESNAFPPVSGAVVTINDNTGNSETLTETNVPGVYATSAIQGVPGRTYTLTVIANDNTYTAVSKMPQPVIIDTLLVAEISGPHGNEKFIQAQFTDPAGIDNFYSFILFKNNNIEKLIFIDDDRLQDGEAITFPLFNPPNQRVSLTTGDSIMVHMQTIDKSVYEYFRTLNELSSGPSLSGASLPANPLSNINNGALGYFSAHSVKSKFILIP